MQRRRDGEAMLRIAKILLIFAAFFSIARAEAAPGPVTVAGGAVQGVTDGNVIHYWGIPFAAPPVGDLRWRAPQPAKPWTGTLTADKFGHDCMQSARPGGPLWPMREPAPSEDCLYLNIWAPADAAPAAKLPVMVWIYGGGFQIGSSATILFDGTQFAKDGVMLVSFNYRLNKFGFFAHPALTKESPDAPLGNYAVLDQIAALKWVKANIAQFGGDPNNVTIFGESAGAMSVQYLMQSPLAQGLLEKAISESGFGRFHLQSFAEAEGKGKAEATKNWGVAGDDVAALRAVPADKVLGDTTMSHNGFWPMIDGKILTMQTIEAFDSGKVAHVPFVVGSNSYEIGLFPMMATGLSQKFAAEWPKAQTLFDGFGRHDPAILEMQVATDLILTEPTRALARDAVTAGMPTYVYYYAYVNPTLRARYPGAPHFFEVPAVFGTMNYIEPHPEAATPKVVEAMNSRWAAFAKTGKPGDWPAFAAGHEEWLEFSAQGAMPKRDLLKPRLDFVDALPSPKTN
jgi:para-nitrobenzyl esterase